VLAMGVAPFLTNTTSIFRYQRECPAQSPIHRTVMINAFLWQRSRSVGRASVDQQSIGLIGLDVIAGNYRVAQHAGRKPTSKP
jgi:hypothetical protein